MSPPGRDVAQLMRNEAQEETAPCKYCRCEIKLYLVEYEECELCRVCLVLGHDFLSRDFENITMECGDVNRLAWKIGEYIWMHMDRKYQDTVDQQKTLMRELTLLDRHRKLVSLLDEADQIIKKDAPTLEVVVKCWGNIFEDMTKILREEYPDERPEEDRAIPED